MRLIDTHCHLNLPECFPVPEPLLDACAEAGVDLILVGVDPATSRRAVELAEGREGVWAIVGRHPNYAHQAQASDLEEIEELASHPKAVAIGEIGLDYHWDFATKDEQESCLAGQLELAETLGKPVVFHCREAYPDLLTTLESRWSKPPVPMLFHCFSGSADDARRALDLGAYFGVDGPITYKKADELRGMIAALPRDRIVLETDSPYLTPAPHRGKENTPLYLPLIAEKLAEVWQLSLEEVAWVTTENARRFFGLP